MKADNTSRNYALIGKSLAHSFSEKYFSKKFLIEKTSASYINLEIEKIEDMRSVISKHKITGFNVTIPFKVSIMDYIEELSSEAKSIGAVNTVVVSNNGWKGYNTDAFGFKESIKPFLKRHHRKALILGTGGASKAVSFVLRTMGLDVLFVSRKPSEINQISYDDINEKTLEFFPFIINCTPLGTFPNINDKPDLPYSKLTENNFLYDLVYNPSETSFLKEGKKNGAQVLNGQSMLELQAEKSWDIWRQNEEHE